MSIFSASRMRWVLFSVINIGLMSGVFAQGKMDGPNLVSTIPLPGVHGKFDHMAVDNKSNKLFLAAKGNNSVEVVDLNSGKTVHSIKGVPAPQGILVVPRENMVFVGCGGDGTLKGFDATTYKPRFSLELGGEADNVRYSPVRQRVYVAYGDGAIAVVDANTFEKRSVIPCGAHPEAFSLDASNNKIWVNIPDIGLIKVFDLNTEKEIATWKTAAGKDNYPMALMEGSHKLVVASRTHPTISILNSDTGKLMQSFACDEDPDAMFYDKKSDRVFLSCGGGSVYILNNATDKSLKKTVIMPTREKARTCKWIPETNTLFVALPEAAGKQAEIRVYR